MAFIAPVDKIIEAMGSEYYTIGVFFDFSKSFDTVEHSSLLEKKLIPGIQNVTLNCFTS